MAECDYKHAIDTDQKLLIADVNFKLKAQNTKSLTPSVRYRTPTLQQLTNYNSAVSEHVAQMIQDDNDATIDFDVLNKALTESAQANLDCVPAKQRRPYISHACWQLLEAKWAAIESGDYDASDALSKQINDRVRHDKEEHLLEQSEEITTQGYKWDGLKEMRAKFKPSFTKFKDSSGNHVPIRATPIKQLITLKIHSGKNQKAILEKSHDSIPRSRMELTKLMMVLSLMRN